MSLSKLRKLKQLAEAPPADELNKIEKTENNVPPESIIPDGYRKKDEYVVDIVKNVDEDTGEILAPVEEFAVSETEVESAQLPYIKIKPNGPFITNSDEFFLTSTVIKTITDQHGNLKDYCPRKLYHLYIKNDIKYHKEVFDYGNYGEYLILGSGAYDTVIDLPKHKITGKKRITQKRIEEQAKIHFPRYYKKYFQGMVLPFYNTQIPIYKYHPKLDVVTRSIIDHFPTITFEDGGVPKLAMVDVKFTANIHSNFGIGWGDPTTMDHLQADMYLRQLIDFDIDLNKRMDPVFDKNVGYDRIFTDVVMKFIESYNITFVNMVFSYNDTSLDNGFKPVIRSFRDPNNPLSSDRNSTLNERMRKTMASIEEIKHNNYSPIPNFDECRDCPVKRISNNIDGYCDKYKELNIT